MSSSLKQQIDPDTAFESEEPETVQEPVDAPAGEKASRKSPSAFRTISEVADDLDVQQHVLRFWETKFTQVKPLKRGGGRRYYRPEDVELLRRIHHLLYTEGYTIKGVQKLMKGQGRQQIIASDLASDHSADTSENDADQDNALSDIETINPEFQADIGVETAPKKVLTEQQRVLLQAMLGDLKNLRDMVSNG